MNKFKSPHLIQLLDKESGSKALVGPSFSWTTLTRLENVVGRHEFSSSSKCVSLHPRTSDEILLLIEWATRIASNVMQSVAEEQVEPLTIDDLRVDLALDSESAMEATIGIFEMWRDFSPPEQLAQALVIPDSTLGPEFVSLEAIAGNLIGALGYLQLDQALLHWKATDQYHALKHLAYSWECALIANTLNEIDVSAFFDKLRRSELARNSANLRHQNDPKTLSKAFVKECWEAWRQRPEQYKSTASFARAMLEKQPDTLKSEVVVARWVRDWSKAAET
jgi:hypothetical protein